MSDTWVLEAIGALEPESKKSGGLSLSAVLLLLRPTQADPEQFEVVFTRRSMEVPTHAGQVSLPGGRLESGESPEEGALREASEEIGIETKDVEIIGRLNELTTISGYHVTPVVGVLREPVEYRPEVGEVARVFEVPLGELLKRERWELHVHTRKQREVPLWYFEFDNEVIWGVTGQLLMELLEYLWECQR